MRRIYLDAADWRCPDDFYDALLGALQAPEWHGRNLDALSDSLSGGINMIQPPFVVEIQNTLHLEESTRALLARAGCVFSDARKNSDADVAILLL